MFGGGNSLQLFKVSGIRVGVHPTWFLILFLFIWWTNDSFDAAITTPDKTGPSPASAPSPDPAETTS